MNKSIASFAITMLTALGLSACSDPSQSNYSVIQIDGSSTVYPIIEAAAEEFQRATKQRITVGISGTGGGFKKFCRGETEIQNASRPILAHELLACQAAGIEFIELPIAYDALTVVVNPNNTFISQMTVDELKRLWEPAAQATITSWQQINPSWPDVPIALFGAGSDSGTFDYFTEAIVGKAKSSRGDFTASEDDNILVQGVAHDKHALAYFGFAYYENNQALLKAVPIATDAYSPAVLPSVETVMSGQYQPLSRPIFIYVSAKAAKQKPEVKAFIDAYLTNAHAYIQEVGFIPLPNVDLAAVTTHWQAQKTGTGFNGTPEVGIKIKDLIKRINECC